MFDFLLQRDVDTSQPECGGLFAANHEDAQNGRFYFHFGDVDIKNSSPVSNEVIGAFGLLNNGYFSLCNNPENIQRNGLEIFLQKNLRHHQYVW